MQGMTPSPPRVAATPPTIQALGARFNNLVESHKETKKHLAKAKRNEGQSIQDKENIMHEQAPTRASRKAKPRGREEVPRGDAVECNEAAQVVRGEEKRDVKARRVYSPPSSWASMPRVERDTMLEPAFHVTSCCSDIVQDIVSVTGHETLTGSRGM